METASTRTRARSRTSTKPVEPRSAARVVGDRMWDVLDGNGVDPDAGAQPDVNKAGRAAECQAVPGHLRALGGGLEQPLARAGVDLGPEGEGQDPSGEGGGAPSRG